MRDALLEYGLKVCLVADRSCEDRVQENEEHKDDDHEVGHCGVGTGNKTESNARRTAN